MGLSVRAHQPRTVRPASLYSKNGALSGKNRWQRSKKRQWPRQFAPHAAPKKKKGNSGLHANRRQKREI